LQRAASKARSAAEHNYNVKRLQAKAINKHAVFFAEPSEAITYHYELDLKPLYDSQDIVQLKVDPRISHQLTLNTDEYGNALQAVAVVYPRLNTFNDESLEQEAIDLINQVQSESHLVYTENHFIQVRVKIAIIIYCHYQARCALMSLRVFSQRIPAQLVSIILHLSNGNNLD